VNERSYPKLCYPHVYVLQGGFCEFFHECTPMILKGNMFGCLARASNAWLPKQQVRLDLSHWFQK
jgi:hypothetical protein